MTVWGIDVGIFCLLVWVVVAFFGVGTWYEIAKPIDEDDLVGVFLCALFWPVIATGIVIVGAGWCVSWIPRAPVRMVLWYLKNGSVPEAKVVK